METQVLGQSFNDTITKTWKSGETSEYRAHRYGSTDYFVAIQRGAREGFDPFASNDEDGYRHDGPELRVMNADGQDVGISLTIYEPEVRYRDEIREATINWSAIGSVDPMVTEVSGYALTLASHMAKYWTEAAMPNLIHELANQMNARIDSKAQFAREAEERAAVLRRLEDPTGRVRIKEDGRKTYHIGHVALKGGNSNYLHLDSGNRVHVDKIEYADVKLSNGAYQRYYTRPMAVQS